MYASTTIGVAIIANEEKSTENDIFEDNIESTNAGIVSSSDFHFGRGLLSIINFKHHFRDYRQFRLSIFLLCVYLQIS